MPPTFTNFVFSIQMQIFQTLEHMIDFNEIPQKEENLFSKQ